MAGQGRRWAAVLIGVLTLQLAGEEARAERVTVRVQITDPADVARDDLGDAKAEVAEIFDAADVDVVWTETHAQLTVMIISPIGKPTPGTECRLGLAVPSRSTAYVFMNRLRRASDLRPVDVPVMLGRVIAHEVGHLLLYPRPHSNSGLMRADIDLAFHNPGRFSPEEERAIRVRLLAPPASQSFQ